MSDQAAEKLTPLGEDELVSDPLFTVRRLLNKGEIGAARDLLGKFPAADANNCEIYRAAIESAHDEGGRELVFELVASGGNEASDEEVRLRVVGCLLARYGTDEELLAFLTNWAPESLAPMLRSCVLADLLRWARHEVTERWTSASLVGQAPPVDLCVSYLRAVHLGQGIEQYRQARDQLFNGLDADAQHRVLRAMPPGLCRPHEVIEQLQAARLVGKERELSSLARKFLFYRDASVDRELLVRPLRGADLFVRYLNSAARARMMQEAGWCSEADPEAAEAPQQAVFHLAQELARQCEEISGHPGRGNLKRAIQYTDRIKPRCGTTLLETAAIAGHAATLAKWLNGRIHAGKPTSFIRLGDGEGAFLPYPPELTNNQIEDRLGHQRDWWGGHGFSAARSDEAGERLIDAIRDADCLGIPPYPRCLHALGEDDVPTTPNQRGVLSVLDNVSRLPASVLASKWITSAHAHMDMFEQDLYPLVLQGVGEVQLIGCHDLSGILPKTMGVEVAKWYATLPEFKFRQMFGQPRSSNLPHEYVEHYDALAEEIRIGSAPVFLVAAGFMGKLLCHRVRSLGGIAIDIGCVGDYWNSKPTRIQPLPEASLPQAKFVRA